MKSAVAFCTLVAILFGSIMLSGGPAAGQTVIYAPGPPPAVRVSLDPRLHTTERSGSADIGPGRVDGCGSPDTGSVGLSPGRCGCRVTGWRGRVDGFGLQGTGARHLDKTSSQDVAMMAARR